MASANITAVNGRNPSGDGKTWLFDLLTGGVTGSGYGPSTGVTNVTLKMTIPGVVATACAQASATISGSVLTVTTLAAVPSSALVSSVTFSIGSGSNLTDGSANTAQGQTDVAVTNGSTVAAQYFALNNAAYALSGLFQDASQASHNTKQQVGADSSVDVAFTGTGCAAMMSLNGTQGSSVDGGAYGSLYNSSFAWVLAPVASGLSDALHTLAVRGGNSFGIDRDVGLIVYGAAPAVSFRADYGISYRLNTTPFTTYGRAEGWAITGAAGYTNCRETSYYDCGIRIRRKCSWIKIWANKYGSKYRVWRNGVVVGAAVADANDTRWGYVTVASGLDSSTEAEYEIRQVYGPQGTRVWDVMTDDPGLPSAAVSALPATIGFYGNSLTAAVTNGDSSGGFASKVCKALGRSVYNRGLPGSTVKHFASGAAATTTGAGETRTADITTLSPAPSKVVNEYGSNDMAQQGAGETAADLQASYQSMLVAQRAGLPSAKIYCLGIFPRQSFNLSTWNAAVQAAVAAVADANIVFVPTTNWITLSDTVDQIHPSDTTGGGNDKIANRLLSLLADAWGTITGPTTGTPGVATSAYTVTLASGATFTGDQTVTLSVANGTITATAVGGSVSGNGTGSVTVTPAAGATSFTFTRTPATGGSDPTVATNGQGWADPGPAAFTATAAGSAYRTRNIPRGVTRGILRGVA